MANGASYSRKGRRHSCLYIHASQRRLEVHSEMFNTCVSSWYFHPGSGLTYDEAQTQNRAAHDENLVNGSCSLPCIAFLVVCSPPAAHVCVNLKSLTHAIDLEPPHALSGLCMSTKRLHIVHLEQR